MLEGEAVSVFLGGTYGSNCCSVHSRAGQGSTGASGIASLRRDPHGPVPHPCSPWPGLAVPSRAVAGAASTRPCLLSASEKLTLKRAGRALQLIVLGGV